MKRQKHTAGQFEIPLFTQASEPFTLVPQVAVDGARIAAEARQHEIDQELSEARQAGLDGVWAIGPATVKRSA
jgi:hypothetical protein